MLKKLIQLLSGKGAGDAQNFSDLVPPAEPVRPNSKPKPFPQDGEPAAPPQTPTTEERRRTDVRRPGGHIPRGDELARPQRPTKSAQSPPEEPHWSEKPLTGDHLGSAAIAGHASQQAVKDKRFDDAWRHLHEQQEHYLAHAAKFGFTAQQTLALAGSIHKSMANILRLEGRHDQALVHMMYYMATARRPPKADQQKLGAYFRRCKFSNTDEAKLQLVMSALQRDPVFDAARGIVAQWRANEGEG